MEKREEKLTLEKIEERVQEVWELALSGDNEIAHTHEDLIYTDTLRAIAKGEVDDPASYAAAALKAEDLDYIRWYA